MGLPLNHSISPGRCDLAPDAVRAAMHKLSCYDCVLDQDVRQFRAHDHGDLELASADPEKAFSKILPTIVAPSEKAPWVLLGGDNGITRPGVHCMGRTLEKVGLLTLDAHLDMRTVENGLHNGNPIRALLADGLPAANISQVGISSFANSWEYYNDAKEYGNTIRLIDECHEIGFAEVVSQELERLSKTCAAIYVDVDLDVMDACYAPGCPGARPGGTTPLQLVQAMRRIGQCPLVTMIDIVEMDPQRDPGIQTALAAGMVLLSFVAGRIAIPSQ